MSAAATAAATPRAPQQNTRSLCHTVAKEERVACRPLRCCGCCCSSGSAANEERRRRQQQRRSPTDCHALPKHNSPSQIRHQTSARHAHTSSLVTLPEPRSSSDGQSPRRCGRGRKIDDWARRWTKACRVDSLASTGCASGAAWIREAPEQLRRSSGSARRHSASASFLCTDHHRSSLRAPSI